MSFVSDPDPRQEHVTDLVLDEWLAGELAPDERARVEAHVASCEACRTKRASFEREHAEFLRAAPRLRRPEAPPSPIAGKPARVLRWPIGAVAATLAAAAALLLVLRPGPGMEPPAREAPREQAVHTEAPSIASGRVKGRPSVSFFVKRGERVFRGSSGVTVHPGDALRFTYNTEQPSHFALLGADASAASVYFPDAVMAARIEPGSDVALDFSIELDAQLGKEQMYALFCETAIALEPLRAELDKSRTLAEPEGCVLQRIELVKVPGP